MIGRKGDTPAYHPITTYGVIGDCHSVVLVAPEQAVADRVFVRQALAGDEGAFETLVRRYHGRVFQFIRRYIRDNDQAWDVFQQVLLKLFVSLPKLCVAREQLGAVLQKGKLIWYSWEKEPKRTHHGRAAIVQMASLNGSSNPVWASFPVRQHGERCKGMK
jgi:hypothetical protein